MTMAMWLVLREKAESQFAATREAKAMRSPLTTAKSPAPTTTESPPRAMKTSAKNKNKLKKKRAQTLGLTRPGWI